MTKKMNDRPYGSVGHKAEEVLDEKFKRTYCKIILVPVLMTNTRIKKRSKRLIKKIDKRVKWNINPPQLKKYKLFFGMPKHSGMRVNTYDFITSRKNFKGSVRQYMKGL